MCLGNHLARRGPGLMHRSPGPELVKQSCPASCWIKSSGPERLLGNARLIQSYSQTCQLNSDAFQQEHLPSKGEREGEGEEGVWLPDS